MLEHAIYSVISPEGAASILWRDTAKAQEAATSMKITAQDLLRFGVIDTIIPEPTGGAHRDPAAAIAATAEAIAAALWPTCRVSTGRRSSAPPGEVHGDRARPRLTFRLRALTGPWAAGLPRRPIPGAGPCPRPVKVDKSLSLPVKFSENLTIRSVPAWSTGLQGWGCLAKATS